MDKGTILRGRCALALGLWAWSCFAVARAVDDGVIAYIAGDYQQALRLLAPAAEERDRTALLFMGMMYEYGHGVAQDKARALRYYRESAAEGDPDARRILSFLENVPPTPSAPASAPSQPPAQGEAETPPPPSMPAAEPSRAMTPPAPAPAPSAGGGPRGLPWILDRDSGHFTLQLMGSSREEDLLQFAHDHELEHEAAVYTLTRRGRPWFALLYGDFATRGAANEALKRLPPAARAWSPWVRSFAEVKEALGRKPAESSRRPKG
jgi:hypothetical protein